MRIVAFFAVLLGVVVCVAGCPSGMETPSPDQPKASFQETPTAGTAVAHAAGRPAAKEPVAAEPGPKQKPASKPTPELTEAILRYLGCKPGDSNVVRLCGMDLKGRGGPPPGVILLGGTQFEQKHVGPSGAVTVIGQAQGEPKVSFEEGTIVELAGGDAFVWKGGNWTPHKRQSPAAEGDVPQSEPSAPADGSPQGTHEAKPSAEVQKQLSQQMAILKEGAPEERLRSGQDTRGN